MQTAQARAQFAPDACYLRAMESPKRGSVTLLGAIALVLTAGLVAALAGAGAAALAALQTGSMEAAVGSVRADPLMMACCQLLGLVVAIGAGVLASHGSEVRYRDALAMRPVPVVVVALALTAGFALQFPLLELAQSLAQRWPVLGMDSDQQLAMRAALRVEGWIDAIAIPLAMVAIPAVGEELLFRGVILPGLDRRYGPRIALVVSALLFGAMHLMPVAVLYAALAGLALGWLRDKTGSVLPCIALHGAFNAAPLMLPAEVVTIEGFNTSAANGASHQPLALWLGCAVVAAICLYLAGAQREPPK